MSELMITFTKPWQLAACKHRQWPEHSVAGGIILTHRLVTCNRPLIWLQTHNCSPCCMLRTMDNQKLNLHKETVAERTKGTDEPSIRPMGCSPNPPRRFTAAFPCCRRCRISSYWCRRRKSESSGFKKIRSSILISAQPNDKLQHD